MTTKAIFVSNDNFFCSSIRQPLPKIYLQIDYILMMKLIDRVFSKHAKYGDFAIIDCGMPLARSGLFQYSEKEEKEFLMVLLMKLYQDRLMDYYQRALFRGTLENPSFSSGSHNPSCGDAISIQGRVIDGILVEAAFQGKGCIISQAAASMLLEHAIGKSLDVVAMLAEPAAMKELIGLPLGPMRARCAELAAEALKKGLADYYAQSC